MISVQSVTKTYRDFTAVDPRRSSPDADRLQGRDLDAEGVEGGDIPGVEVGGVGDEVDEPAVGRDVGALGDGVAGARAASRRSSSSSAHPVAHVDLRPRWPRSIGVSFETDWKTTKRPSPETCAWREAPATVPPRARRRRAGSCP